MGFAELTALAIIGYVFYLLVIRGIMWPILLLIIGIGGGRMLVESWFPATKATVATFLSYSIPWSVFICSIITLLGIGVVAGNDD